MPRPLVTRAVERPTHLLPRTRPSGDERADAWAWLVEAAALT